MTTSIRLAPEIEQRMDFLATRTGRTKAYYLREIIEQGIEDMEDYYLAADVLERVRKGHLWRLGAFAARDALGDGAERTISTTDDGAARFIAEDSQVRDTAEASQNGCLPDVVDGVSQ